MQGFILNITQFIQNLISSVGVAINNYMGEQMRYNYNAFLEKNVFLDNSFIGLNLTWGEMFRFISIWFLAILFIVLFVKFIIKILGIFKTRFND